MKGRKKLKNQADLVSQNNFILILAQLFNDDRDPSQHILQLKSKYASMRKNMETKIEELNDKRRNLIGDNVSIKSKYQVISKLEKDSMEKLDNLDHVSVSKLQQLDTELSQKFKERNEFEAINRATNQEIISADKYNNQLDFDLQNSQKQEELKQKFFEVGLKLKDDFCKNKADEYLEVDKRVAAFSAMSSDDPVVQVEFNKNTEYKKKIEHLERDLITNNLRIEELDLQNEYLAKKKEEMITERKKFIALNEELKREIEQKNQLNEMRIQKKVKENNSEEIAKQEENLKGLVKNVEDFEKKIFVENDKAKMFASEIIKLNLEIKKRLTKKTKMIEVVEEKFHAVDELKDKYEMIKDTHNELHERYSKSYAQHEILINRNKLLSEEHASITSRLKFISDNYDISSNLRKISVDDLAILTQTNNLVNESINAFASKVGTFKSTHLPKNLFE